MSVKAAIIGAGSLAFTRRLAHDVLCVEELQNTVFSLTDIERECAHMTRNIYHLDGPQALRFLDRIIEIPNLHAVQWVPGPAHRDWRLWVDVYRRIRQRQKAFSVTVPPHDVEEFASVFRPEGVWLTTHVADEQEAGAVLRAISRWGVSARATA